MLSSGTLDRLLHLLAASLPAKDSEDMLWQTQASPDWLLPFVNSILLPAMLLPVNSKFLPAMLLQKNSKFLFATLLPVRLRDHCL